MGLPDTSRTESAAPPRVSPSILVNTAPVMPTASLKLTEQMGGAAADVGLTPQLSAEDMNQLAMEGVRKSVSPGMVRRQKIKKVPKNGAAQASAPVEVERA